MSKKNNAKSTNSQAAVLPKHIKNEISSITAVQISTIPYISLPPTSTNVTLLSTSSFTVPTLSSFTVHSKVCEVSEVTRTSLASIEAKKAAAIAAEKAEIAIKKSNDFFNEAIKNANEAAAVAKAKLLAIQTQRLNQQLQKSSPPMLPDDVQEASH